MAEFALAVAPWCRTAMGRFADIGRDGNTVADADIKFLPSTPA
jgi:hypothetical protein